jgi:hypothetical protein
LSKQSATFLDTFNTVANTTEHPVRSINGRVDNGWEVCLFLATLDALLDFNLVAPASFHLLKTSDLTNHVARPVTFNIPHMLKVKAANAVTDEWSF